jgi:hypothetical protein
LCKNAEFCGVKVAKRLRKKLYRPIVIKVGKLQISFAFGMNFEASFLKV